MLSDQQYSLSFLATNENPPQEDFFQGYFFWDHDYVNGTQGAAAFQASTGREITGGYDGCYVHIQRHGTAYEFNTDFSGYKVLYYYHDGDIWAVSNSFAQVVNYIRKYKGLIKPNYSHLGSITSTNSTNNQLFSFETLAHGIRVLPRATTLVITPEKAHFIPWKQRAGTSYREALHHHLELWVSRFETLLNDERIQFSIELTGGLDSRTNLALVLKGMERLGTVPRVPRFTCGGKPDTSENYRIASELCSYYGLNLNPPNQNKRSFYSPREAYTRYQDLSLGVYHPLIIPAIAPSARRVQISGAGGEVHRDYYNPHRASGFFRGHSKRNVSNYLGYEAAQDGQISLEYMNLAGNPHPLRAHYREFRHRYHVGRMPRFSTCFTPLDSTTAEAAQLVAGRDRLDDGQFNYDVLYSLDRKLIDFAFHSPTKIPNTETHNRFNYQEVLPDASPGKVWIGTEPDLNRPATSAAQRYHVVKDRMSAALEDDFVQAFWGNSTRQQARELMEKLSQGDSIGNAVDAYPIVGLLAAHLVSPTR